MFEKSATSKLIYRYKPFKIKNGDNFVEVALLLLAENFAVSGFFD